MNDRSLLKNSWRLYDSTSFARIYHLLSSVKGTIGLELVNKYLILPPLLFCANIVIRLVRK